MICILSEGGKKKKIYIILNKTRGKLKFKVLHKIFLEDSYDQLARIKMGETRWSSLFSNQFCF